MVDRFLSADYPHRINLLVTFRERFGPTASHPLNVETCRDLFRCAKDISMAMVRYFCEELGVKNKEHQSGALDFGSRPSRPFTIAYFKDENELDSSPNAQAVKAVLLAANKAVAHSNVSFIDAIPSDDVIVKAITQVEEWVRQRIYKHNSISLDDMMALDNNAMHRERSIKAL